MDDDLDAFFDDVENAVKEVQETNATDGSSQEAAATTLSGNDGESADPKADTPTNETEERPAKRSKVVVASASSAVGAAKQQPVKAIVASSVPVISIVPPLPAGPPPANYVNSSTTASSSNKIPPPPPPPPFPNSSQQSQYNSQLPHQQAYPQQSHIQNQSQLMAAENGNKNDKKYVRSAAGQTWEDPTLTQWPENDFRLFVGNLAKDLKQHHLEEAFSKYPSFAMARIPTNKTDGKSRGYGFVSVLDPKDCARAIREMDQSWLGSRPIKVKRSEWKDREWKEVQKKGKQEKRYKKRFGI